MSTKAGPVDDLFSRVRAEHGEIIRATVRKLVAPTDQDDVEAAVWVSIWTALQRFNGRSSVKTFIYPIVRRRIADYFRAKYREARLLRKAESELPTEDFIAREDPPKAIIPSPAELRVFRWLAEGKSNDEISAGLFISRDTVRSHIKNLYKKTKLRDRGALVLTAYRFWKEKTS